MIASRICTLVNIGVNRCCHERIRKSFIFKLIRYTELMSVPRKMFGALQRADEWHSKTTIHGDMLDAIHISGVRLETERRLQSALTLF
jgi:hypothetical protein